jgi:hypothetical protein
VRIGLDLFIPYDTFHSIKIKYIHYMM